MPVPSTVKSEALIHVKRAALIMLQHQLELLNALSMQFASNEYRLLIIDSIMNCFRVDYCGRGELADRQQKLNQFLSKLAHMAEGSPFTLYLSTSPANVLSEFNVCVLMVRFSQFTERMGLDDANVELDQSSSKRPRCQCPLCRC